MSLRVKIDASLIVYRVDQDQCSTEITTTQKRSFDRMVNFTDAVVAIAITLQLLPLMDIKGPGSGSSMLDVLLENSSQLFAFLISFLIIAYLWIKHNQVFNILRTYDVFISWLNTFWMLGIVFFPWPAAMYGSLTSEEFAESHGVGLLYWWTLAAISGLGCLIARHAWHNPHLLESCVRDIHDKRNGYGAQRGVGFFIYFLVIGVVSEFAPQFAPYLMFGIIPINLLLKGQRRIAI